MRVLLTGANGFIGRHIAEVLLGAGHEVVAVVRPGREAVLPPGMAAVASDFAQDTTPEVWRPRLQGIDVVVNCAGILRESGHSSFYAVHEAAPLALFQAAVQAGVRKIIQISALGEPMDAEFIASKHRADAALLSLPIAAVIIRPSVVYSLNGSYGGTSLLRALAALPGAVFLPGRGEQRIQPIAAEDLAHQVLAAMSTSAADGKVVYAGAPEAVSLRDYLLAWRRWLGMGNARIISVPMGLVRPGVRLGELLAPGPFNRTIMTMLERGNVLPGPDDAATVLGTPARALTVALASRASYVQDRWHARLYFLKPLLTALVILTWFISALAGFCAQPAQLVPFADALSVSTVHLQYLDYGASALDAVLGLALLLRRRVRLVLSLMLLSVLAYTAVFTVFLPGLWLEPLGGLMKNLLVIPALLFLLLTEDAA